MIRCQKRAAIQKTKTKNDYIILLIHYYKSLYSKLKSLDLGCQPIQIH